MPPRWRRERPVLAAVFTVALLGCAPPRVDTSSDDTFEASLGHVRDSIPEARREAFDQAVLTIGAEHVSLDAGPPGGAAGDAVSAGLKAALAGKTADEILAEAARLEAAHSVKARADLQAEIAVLVSKQQKAFAARQDLRRFEVRRASLVPADGRSGSRPSIHLDVRNGTAHAVSRAYFEAVVDSPGRTLPLIRNELFVPASRPLGAGESATWQVEPGSLETWSSAAIPADAALRVSAVRLDGANGEVLFDARGYTEDDAARLVSLQYQLAMLGDGGKGR